MIQSGAYSAKYQQLVHEQFFAFREGNDKQSKKTRSKERNLSKETKRRQRALEDRKRQMAEDEEERRQAVLKERRREQDRARASFRQAVQPRVKAVTAAPDRRQVGSRGQCGRGQGQSGQGVSTALDVKEIAEMVAGSGQVSVPSLDEMLAQLRGDSPVPTHKPPLVGRAEETSSATGNRVQGSSPLPVPLPDGMPNTSCRVAGSIYSRTNYVGVVQDSLEVEEGVAQSPVHPSQWADKVSLHDSLEDSQGSLSGLHLSEPVLGISRELERVVSSRPHSEVDLLARLSSAIGPQPSSTCTDRQPTSILKKSGQKTMLKQMLSNAVEASSPPASQLVLDSKHVRFADDPNPAFEADCEISNLAANFHAKGGSGSSAHFLFSRGSEFAFRPLKNGLVLQGGEKPSHEASHQSGAASHSSDAPPTTSMDGPQSSLIPSSQPPSHPSLASEHTDNAMGRVCQEGEGGMAVNQTPTDDQISKLWSQMRGYLAENRALQETQRAGLQRLKRSTQLGWQRRQEWGTTATQAESSRQDQTRTASGSLRDDRESPSRAPLQGAAHPVQEWRGPRKGAGRARTAARQEEGGRSTRQAVYSQQEPTDSVQVSSSRDRRDTSKLSLRHQEQRLMESIERLNSQLKLKLPVQPGASQSRAPLPLAPPTSSIPSSHSQRMTRTHSGSVPAGQQKGALRDLPNTRTRQNPRAIALAADHHARSMNSRTELGRAFHRRQHFH